MDEQRREPKVMRKKAQIHTTNENRISNEDEEKRKNDRSWKIQKQNNLKVCQ